MAFLARTLIAVFCIYQATQYLHFKDQKAFGAVYADSYERHYMSYKKSKIADKVLELPGI